MVTDLAKLSEKEHYYFSVREELKADESVEPALLGKVRSLVTRDWIFYNWIEANYGFTFKTQEIKMQ